MADVLLLFVLVFGFFAAKKQNLGSLNPFSWYFFSWGLAVISYVFLKNTFIPVAESFFYILIAINLLIIATMVFLIKSSIIHGFGAKNYFYINDKISIILQAVIMLAMPFAYQKANLLSGGNIFTTDGYTQLRRSLTLYGDSFGVLAYFSTLSFAISSVRLFAYFRQGNLKWLTLLSIAQSLFFVYINTGRTYALFFVLMVSVPLFLSGFLKTKGALIIIAGLLFSFVLIATLTEKGISSDGDAQGNIESILENLRGYTVAPLVAFSELIGSTDENSWGKYAFRFIFALLYSMNILQEAPISLMKEYAFVPDETNVYTVYETYYKDFGYIGLLSPVLFIIGHWFLYLKALNDGGRWIFYYATSLYPLTMQFFQDQYLSLVSTWIQVFVWYSVLIKFNSKE